MAQPPYGYPQAPPPPGWGPPPPPPKRPNSCIVAGLGCGGIVVLLAIIGSLAGPRDGGRAKERDTTPSHERPRTAIDAWVAAQSLVKQGLKSPDSADFGGLFDGYQKPDERCTDLGDDKWRCNGYVKAQNAFGVVIQARWNVTMQYEGDEDETWRAVEGPTIQE